MANTQEFIDALKEADKVAFIKTIIPKGDKGDTGPAGPAGPKGPKGDTGPAGGGSGLDPADKTKLDFIAVTKAADLDAMGAKVALIDGTTGINFDEIILDGDRATTSDIDDPNAVPATLERFISIAGLRHALTQFGALYEKLLGNPAKDDQILSSKKDGTRSWIDAPSGGAGIAPADQAKLDHITTTKDVDLDQMATLDDVSSAGGLFQFDYKIEVGTVDATPAAKKLAFDNADPKLATKIYINKTDRTNTDMSLFLDSLHNGDYLNLHDNNNINDFIAYDVTGDAVQKGDIFEVSVRLYDENGTLTNGERVFVHWKATPIPNPKLEHLTISHDIDLDHINVTKDINLDTVSRAAHLHGTTVPADTLGKDGDVYFKIA